MNISHILSLGPVMPVIVIEQADLALPLGEALLAGGIKTIEIKTRIKKGIGLKLKLKFSGEEKYSNKIKQKVVAPQVKKANQKRLQSMELLDVVILFKDCL